MGSSFVLRFGPQKKLQHHTPQWSSNEQPDPAECWRIAFHVFGWSVISIIVRQFQSGRHKLRSFSLIWKCQRLNRDLISPCGLYCGVCAILFTDSDNNVINARSNWIWKSFFLLFGGCSLYRERNIERSLCKQPDPAQPASEATAVDVYSTFKSIGYPVSVRTDYMKAMDRIVFLMDCWSWERKNDGDYAQAGTKQRYWSHS